MERIKGVWKENGQTYRTRIFASNFEINTENGISHEVCYISSPSGLAAMHVTEIPLSGGAGVGNLFYTYTDHLGSIISVTNSTGTVIARQNFDAWGRRRNALDYSYLPNNTKTIHNGLAGLNAANPNLPAWLFRGYTGHEMLDEFALINMNARLYDPVVGMMLSCDNYVSDATNTQDYHRYCYARNNPLKFTDPSGNNPAIIAGAVIGGAINLAINWKTIQESSNPFLSGVIAFGIGATCGAIGTYTGLGAAAQFGSTGVVSGITVAAISYMFSAPLQSGLNHGALGTPTMTNQQFFTGLGMSMGIGGVMGGIDAYRHDGDILNGNGYTFESGAGYKVSKDEINIDYQQPNILQTNDCLLEERMLKEYGLCKGDYGIDFTTSAKIYGDQGKYAYTKNGQFVNSKTREVVNGFVIKGENLAHISPFNTNATYAETFRATAGHEWLHAWHALNIGYVNISFSENAAYDYSYQVYNSNPSFQFKASLEKEYIGYYPASYKWPNFLKP